MLTSESCQLTIKDYAILEAMEERFPHRDDLMRSILHQKLSNAVVMFREDISPTVVTLNSRVTYRVNGGPAETRVIVDDEMRGLVGMTVISITQPRGLAMLGVSEGESVVLRRPDGDPEKITVVKVARQPEVSIRSVKERHVGGWTSRWNRLFDKPDRAPSHVQPSRD
nr:GreA/GreB family elongation factor [Mesorhizobium sp. WSM4875]